MPHLILIRHGQTDWNLCHRFQGAADVRLNATGREQARALARRLAAEPLDLILSSDLSRAWETASIVAEYHNLSPIIEPRLRETGFGEWEGLTAQDVAAAFPGRMETWREDPYAVTPPGGESMGEIVARLGSLLAELRRMPDEETVLLSAHGAVIRSLLCLAIGLPQARRWSLSLEETSVTRLDLTRGRAVLTMINDTRHLLPELIPG